MIVRAPSPEGLVVVRWRVVAQFGQTPAPFVVYGLSAEDRPL